MCMSAALILIVRSPLRRAGFGPFTRAACEVTWCGVGQPCTWARPMYINEGFKCLCMSISMLVLSHLPTGASCVRANDGLVYLLCGLLRVWGL